MRGRPGQDHGHPARRGRQVGVQRRQVGEAPGGLAEAVRYYQAAFGAVERYRLEDDAGCVVVARPAVGPADFWLREDAGSSPRSLDRQPVRKILTVDDPDSVLGQAVAAGATEVAPVSEGHGWRVGRVADPFGHHWEIGRPLP